jgi:hypothetical protein
MAEPSNSYDQLRLTNDKAINKLLAPNESVILSCKVIKYNKRNKAQQRNLLLTTTSIFNLKGKKKKRRIGIAAI